MHAPRYTITSKTVAAGYYNTISKCVSFIIKVIRADKSGKAMALPLDLDKNNNYSFFPTYYSILVFSKILPIILFKLPIIFVFLSIILNYSSILMAESGWNDLHTLNSYTMTKP